MYMEGNFGVYDIAVLGSFFFFFYTIYDEIGSASDDRAFRSLYRSRSSHVFSQCQRLISGAYMLEVNKHAR